MSKTKEVNKVDGEVTQALPNTMFRVKFSDGREILATLAGRMRRRYVRVFPGDRVSVEMTRYDEERGRIVYRY